MHIAILKLVIYYVVHKCIFSSLAVNSGCTDGEVRLAGGKTEMEGRVEVCYNHTWWAVSASYNWDLRVAAVVCRNLHYPSNCELINANGNTMTISYAFVGIQGQFQFPLHILEGAMPQYCFSISNVLVRRRHCRSVNLATTPLTLFTIMAIKCTTGLSLAH